MPWINYIFLKLWIILQSQLYPAPEDHIPHYNLNESDSDEEIPRQPYPPCLLYPSTPMPSPCPSPVDMAGFESEDEWESLNDPMEYVQ